MQMTYRFKPTESISSRAPQRGDIVSNIANTHGIVNIVLGTEEIEEGLCVYSIRSFCLSGGKKRLLKGRRVRTFLLPRAPQHVEGNVRLEPSWYDCGWHYGNILCETQDALQNIDIMQRLSELPSNYKELVYKGGNNADEA